jgi:hypothetical protein
MRFIEFKPLTESPQGPLKVPQVPADLQNIQRALASFKFDVQPTGVLDDRTKQAVSKAQAEVGLPQTGSIDHSFVDAINSAMTVIPGMIDYISSGLSDVGNAVVKAGKSAIDAGSDAVSTMVSSNKNTASKGREVIIGNEKRTGGSISWRTNNPGNVQYGSKARSFGAIGSIKASDGEPVAIMPTLDHGWRMQIALWRTPKYNNGTINQGCRTWAKAVGDYKGIHPYTIALADAAGVSVHTKVSELSDAQLKNIVKRQAKLEGFKVGTVTTV